MWRSCWQGLSRLVGAPWVQSETSRSAARRIRSWIEHAVGVGILPGAVVLVAKRGERVLEEAVGYRDVATGSRLRRRDLFFLASATKPLAATAIVSLVDDGALELDRAPIDRLPSLRRIRLASGERVRAPTVREMLSHTAGMFGVDNATPEQHRLVWNFRGTLAESAEQILQEPLEFPPGSAYRYGGASVTVAARLAESLTGLPFDEFVDRRLLYPLEMSDTFYRASGRRARSRALLHKAGPDGLQPTEGQPWDLQTDFVLAPGGMTSTARNLQGFLELHLNRGEHAGRRILSEALALEMRRDQTGGSYRNPDAGARRWRSIKLSNAQGYGLGWVLDERGPDGVARVFYHSGLWGALIWGDASDGLAVVLLTQIGGGRAMVLWRDIIELTRSYWGTPATSKSTTISVPDSLDFPFDEPTTKGSIRPLSKRRNRANRRRRGSSKRRQST